ncbi:PRTRC system protein E [Capnocytophaga canis]|uniref:PRTRC system protein E n=1 Tax=Capnocytophaga canis TaxID=1848903 RepID=UPI0015626F28|nr:PRTRC system protein E [Capnocytophaga canis]
METNFFNQIAMMNVVGTLQMTLQQGQNGQYIVSVLLQNDQCSDPAKNGIPPLVLKGTAEELDGGFFQSIVRPLEETSSLLVNMENYIQAQEHAKRQSAMEKEKTEKAQKKYDEAMKKVSELEAQGKYREAWTKLPPPNEFPDQAEKIRKKRSELSAHFTPTLFENAE